MIHGIIPVWKPIGITSFDVIFRMRKILDTRRIGHTGTLDPEVDGVLVLCIGEAARLVHFLQEGSKTYYGEVTLGIATETQDIEGDVVARKTVAEPIADSDIDEVLASFVGTIEQIPPMHSSVSVNGRRLYEYAREGIEVERPVRQADIYAIERVGESVYDPENQIQTFRFQVDCGKGTYVRTLSYDIGKALGYPSYMSQLTRTATSGFNQEQALTLDVIRAFQETGELMDHIQTLEAGLAEFPRIDLSDDQYPRIYYAQVVGDDYFGDVVTEPTALFYQGHAIAIYHPHESKPGLLKPLRMFLHHLPEELRL